MTVNRQQSQKSDKDSEHSQSAKTEQQAFEQSTVSGSLYQSLVDRPITAQKPENILTLQRIIGNQAVQRMIVATGQTPTIQRDPEEDLLNALLLENWSEAVTLLNQLSDADLNTQVGQQSPEALFGLERAARQARVTRVQQAIQSVQLGSGTQVDTDEGSTFRTPVRLFQSGVMIAKDVRFLKRGNFHSNDDFITFKNRIMEAVRTRLTNRFKLKIETPGGQAQAGDGEYPIRVRFIENPSAPYRMRLFGQRHGRAGVTPTRGSFYELGIQGETQESETTIAHESAHVLLGAHDEYADAQAPASRQVFTDHSLMGNYPSEGEAQAELKPRHFGALVRLVSGWFPGRTITIIQ